MSEMDSLESKLSDANRNALLIFFSIFLIGFSISFFAGLIINFFNIWTILFAIGILLILFILFYKFLLIHPINTGKTNFEMEILYDRENGIVKDYYQGYHPQSVIYQAFKYCKESLPEVNEGILNADFNVRMKTFDYLVGYYLIQFLKFVGHSSSLEVINPLGLDNNPITDFYFNNRHRNDIVLGGMSQFSLQCPKKTKIKLVQENTGPKIEIVGTFGEIFIKAKRIIDWPVNNITTGPYTILNGLYVSKYYEDEVLRIFPNLMLVNYSVAVEYSIKQKYFIFRPDFLFVQYIDQILMKMKYGSSFGGLDINFFKFNQQKNLNIEIFESLKVIQAILSPSTHKEITKRPPNYYN